MKIMLVRLRKAAKRVKNEFSAFDWKNLSFRSDRYEWPIIVNIEPTWSSGFGLGVGFGVWDAWIGWPRKESLHYVGCGH